MTKDPTYTLNCSQNFLSPEEQSIFKSFILHSSLDESIWNVFSKLFESATKHTRPMLVRVYEQSDLVGAAIVIRCSKYGRALFSNRTLSAMVDIFKLPFILWIKFGCCMDMMSNPGFVKKPEIADEVNMAISNYLQKHFLLTIINDYTVRAPQYPAANVLPALPHATIDCSEMTGIKDYSNRFKNLKRKIRRFEKKGGTFEIVQNKLSEAERSSLTTCFVSTAEKSVFYLPYQDLYLHAALTTSESHLKQVFYFIARLNDRFVGYQAAILCGKQLNALHGAFDRNLKTTFHAYDIMFLKMTEFALDHHLDSIDFGAVLNLTKQKMVNRTTDMSYFLFSKYRLVQFMFSHFLKGTKIQGKKQLRFRE